MLATDFYGFGFGFVFCYPTLFSVFQHFTKLQGKITLYYLLFNLFLFRHVLWTGSSDVAFSISTTVNDLVI